MKYNAAAISEYETPQSLRFSDNDACCCSSGRCVARQAAAACMLRGHKSLLASLACGEEAFIFRFEAALRRQISSTPKYNKQTKKKPNTTKAKQKGGNVTLLLLLLFLIETMRRHLIFIIHSANDVQSRSAVACKTHTYIRVHVPTDRRTCCATPSGKQANRTRLLELCMK